MPNYDCKKLHKDLLELQDLKKRFDDLAKHIVIQRDETIGRQLAGVEDIIKDLISDIEKELDGDFEARVLDEMEKIYDSASDKGKVDELNYILLNLAGLDSPRSWILREKLFGISEVSPDSAITSLAGLDSDKAWHWRDHFIRVDVRRHSLAISLVGLDSQSAWNMREDFEKHDDLQSLVVSVIGVASGLAWAIRDDAIMKKVHPEIIMESLTGLDSDEAWIMRGRLYKLCFNHGPIVDSLTGLDSPRAWEMREKYWGSGADKSVLGSLAGVDSERAWEMREEFLKTNPSDALIFHSLAGLNSERAWKMRGDLYPLCSNLSKIHSLNGDYLTCPKILCKNKK